MSLKSNDGTNGFTSQSVLAFASSFPDVCDQHQLLHYGGEVRANMGTTIILPLTTSPSHPLIMTTDEADEDEGYGNEASVVATTTMDDSSGKPTRPLSAYNLFFRDERRKIIEVTPTRPEGKPKRSHGKIGFKELARNIAARWKTLDPVERSIYEGMAQVEKDRHKEVVACWKKQQQMSRQQNVPKKKKTQVKHVTPKEQREAGGTRMLDMEFPMANFEQTQARSDELLGMVLNRVPNIHQGSLLCNTLNGAMHGRTTIHPVIPPGCNALDDGSDLVLRYANTKGLDILSNNLGGECKDILVNLFVYNKNNCFNN